MQESIIKTHNLKLTLAHEGNEAFQIFTKKAFDIVLLDLFMPYMNGIEVAKKIVEYCKEKQRRKPIITLLTANTESSLNFNQAECGIEFVISKPLNKQHLREIISKVQ